MPTRWGALPESGVDKNPTPFERTIRKGRVILIAALLIAVAPPLLLIPAWLLFSDTIKWVLGSQIAVSLIMMGVVLLIIIHLCAAAILAERKLAGYIQDRYGPNRVGWGGVLQPVVDGLKFFLKEDVTPANVDKPVYMLAPPLAFVIALVAFPVIPWAGQIVWPWTGADGEAISVTTQVASLDIGILYMLAIGSMSVYGVVLAGWSSNNKYAHYGGMRCAAQMLSYEIPLGLVVLAIVLVAGGSLRLEVIQAQQIQTGIWNCFLHPIAFVMIMVTALAEANRAPFDLAECEQELVGGFHTEYSSMKFALFFLAEYAHLITASALLVTLFLGGWEPLPFLSLLEGTDTWWAALLKFGVFWTKVCLVVAFFMVIRWTIPRFRFDQLMRMAWKGLIPAGMVVVVVAGAMVASGWTIDRDAGLFSGHNYGVLLAHLVANGIVLAGILFFMARSRTPVTGRQANLPPVEAPRSGATEA